MKITPDNFEKRLEFVRCIKEWTNCTIDCCNRLDLEFLKDTATVVNIQAIHTEIWLNTVLKYGFNENDVRSCIQAMKQLQSGVGILAIELELNGFEQEEMVVRGIED